MFDVVSYLDVIIGVLLPVVPVLQNSPYCGQVILRRVLAVHVHQYQFW
jgi:hypothetical protein